MVEQRLLDILVCPWCLGDLVEADNRLTCAKCRAVYSISDDIPNMLVEEADLYCGACSRSLEKQPPYAVCPPCGLYYRMDVRIDDSIERHGRRLCPACLPEEVELTEVRNERECPRCGARHPAKGGAAALESDP